MPNPYSPDETPSELFTEKTWLQGCILGSVAYGIQFALFVGCISLLWRQTTGSDRKCNIVLMTYVGVMFGLGTIFMVCSAAFTQLVFITDRNYPGGPDAVENDFFAAPVDEGGNVAFVIQCWLADALLVWRCTVVYRGSRFPTWAVALGPCLILVGSIVSGIMWSLQISASSIHVHASQVVNWTIPFLSLTISLNILVTIAIVARIQMYRRRLSQALGSHHTSHYTSVSAMIVESAAIYSAFAIVLLVTFAINSPVFNIFLQAMSQVQISTTLLIIYRVAQGRAWTSKTSETVLTSTSASNSTISFPMRFMTPRKTFRSRTDTSQTFIDDGISGDGAAATGTVSNDIASEAYLQQKEIVFPPKYAV